MHTTTYFLQGCRCGDKIKPTEAEMIHVSLITFTKGISKRFLVNFITQQERCGTVP